LNEAEEAKFEYALRGKAWKVYWLLLKSGRPLSVREVQKALHFSSPSVAQHHLEQLRELGLVEKQNVGGHYFLVNEVKIGVLRHFVKLGKLLFPRYFFYAIFSTTFYLAYLFTLMQGVYIFNVTLTSGLVLRGNVTHLEDGTIYWNVDYEVKRALYIEKVLYTMSDKKIKMNSLDDLHFIKEIELP
jgi:DNA-binding transcriptional ArsR family regulator